MTYALIEVEATARKAARGAGYCWGMAEEAGKATRWLCAAGIDGVAALASILNLIDGKDLGAWAPTTLDENWRAKNGSICPLLAGAALSDSASLWGKCGKRIDKVVAPILLLPFAAYAARRLGTTVSVQLTGVSAVTDGKVVSLAQDGDTPALDEADSVSITVGSPLGAPLLRTNRATVAESDWETLNRFAHRTYAPNTESSRLRGAGAGLKDND